MESHNQALDFDVTSSGILFIEMYQSRVKAHLKLISKEHQNEKTTYCSPIPTRCGIRRIHRGFVKRCMRCKKGGGCMKTNKQKYRSVYNAVS